MNINIERLEKIFDENMYLMEVADDFFEDTDELGDWYVDACRVRVANPSISDEELMPDKLHLAMMAVGLNKSKRSGNDFLDIQIQKSVI